MKILFTSHKFYPVIGGIETNSEILAKYFSENGHEVRLVTQTKYYKEDRYDFKVYRKPSIFKLFFLYQWADLVYQSNIELGVLWPNLFFWRPFVVSLNTWLRNSYGKRRLVDLLKIFVLLSSKKVIAVSRAIQEDSFKHSIVIGNPYRDQLFRKLGHVERKQSIAYLGRFVSDKGVELLIRSYAKLELDSKPLTLIGSGPNENEYKKLAKELGVKLNITGPLIGDKLVYELNKHKILVIPSLWEEPFGNIALEGMACGCLILASDGGGLPDAVGKAGVLFSRGSIEDLTRKLKNLYYGSDIDTDTDLEIYTKLHLENHSQKKICAKYLNILVKSIESSQKSDYATKSY